MKKFLFAVIAAAAFGGTSALAADLPTKAPVYKAAPVPAPVLNWTGCYIGGNLGYAWAHKSFSETDGDSNGSHTADGWVGGGQIGCDYQFNNNWVIGIQGMWDWANLTGSNTVDLCQPLAVCPFTIHTKVDSFATLTAQLGYLLNPTTKLYGKAGIGWVRDKFTCDNVDCNPAFSASGTRSGFDLGIGVTWMFAPNWDFFVEYDHMWLGSKTLNFTDGIGDSFQESIKQDFNKILVGIDYRFNWGKAPVVTKY